MKRIFLAILTAGSLIVGLTTCKKEYPLPVTASGGNTSFSKPLVLHLVADEWINYGSEVYVNTFSGVLLNANTTPDRVSVYLDSDKDTAINLSPITFEGHRLWARATTSDIIIVYRCEERVMPFGSLNIKAVIN
jgi:hypothetical protein